MASSRKTRRAESGISSWITRAVLLELESRGIDAGPLLQRHQLQRQAVLDPDGWIPQRHHAGFYRDAIAASGDPALGIGAGRRVPIHATRVAGHCAALSATLREAMETWGAFATFVVDDTRFGTRSEPGFDAVFWTRPPALLPLHDDGPSFATSLLGFMEFALGRKMAPTEVKLTGPTPASTKDIVAALGAPTRWGAEHFEIRFPPGTLDLPLLSADPHFRAQLVQAVQRDLSMRRGKTTAERVRAAILHVGFDQASTMARVARELGLSTRTLQRSLAEEGLTYSRLRGDVLRDAAVTMLAEEDATVTDVAFRLGFASRTTFHHAIKRWTGKRPGELRAGAPAPPR